MLYVFQVDTGQMLNFEMDVAISTVQTLKSKILSVQGIPLDKQVLLVSGGEILEGSSRVCNYAAGTDTNPIFLFNKQTIDGSGGDQSISSGQQQGSGDGIVNLPDPETIQKQIENASNLPHTYTSVVTRTQLAQHLYDLGKELTRKCEVLIHHQHLQHQGWAAVVANLDDIVGVFNSRMQAFVSAYEQFFGEFSKEVVYSYVDGLDSTLKTLDTIKFPEYYERTGNSNNEDRETRSIVQWLLEEHFQKRAPPSLSTTTTTTTTSNLDQSLSPLHAHLQSMATTTRKTYDHLTSENFLQTLQQECTGVTEKATAANMKEIKGLEERLYGLDQLLQEAKNLVVDQHELTQAFHQNVSRASDLRDSSIFPDLCASHQHQLVVMQKNHSQLEDIRRRCGKAKEELTGNLITRLKWIAFVQKSLSDVGGKISVFHESLKRLRGHVNVLHQLHTCEDVFREYLKEVSVRGRVGRKLKGICLKIVQFNGIAERENVRRGEFREAFGGHFLNQGFNVLIEDREVKCVAVPNLVDYLVVGGDLHESDEEYDEDNNESNRELVRKVKELESVIEKQNRVNSSLEEKIKSLEARVCEEEGKARILNSQLLDCRMKGRIENERLIKALSQVSDLKKLIDEFRVKEDETIRLHAAEIRGFEGKVRELEVSCNERVVELTRMLEFECAQKIKTVEESHKMEYDAMLKRFKLVNKTSVFGGSNERIGNNPSVSPVNPTAPKRFGECSAGSIIDRRSSIVAATSTANASSNQIVFSDEEEDEYMDLGSGRKSLVGDYNNGGGRDDNNEGGERGGSLERAVDAAAAFLDSEDDQMGGGGGSSGGGERSSEVVVSERVVNTAMRLYKLSRISISTCRVGGEANLFYWNDKFNSFTVYLNNRNVHFLNTSEKSATGGGGGGSSQGILSANSLLFVPGSTSSTGGAAGALPLSQESEASLIKPSSTKMFIANITDKEFCVARRAQNRYNVPEGFHFYRVKCKVIEVLNE